VGGYFIPQRKLEKDSFAVDPSSIIKLEACDHVEEITKGGMYFRQILKLNGFPPKRKKSLQLKTFHFLHLKP
jgi:hypothetical protein